ncbi:MAG: hypothetical protein MJZ33_04215 [Paludibacteraceae bacterium]|nr:hypothetical protein [Paludibacteraceae bacterium]
MSLKHKAGKALKIIGVAAGMESLVACQDAKAQESSEINANVPQKIEWDYMRFVMGIAPYSADETQWQEMAEFISLFPNDTFLVVGHSGDGGPLRKDDPERKWIQKYSRGLADSHARYLRRVLINNGVDSTRIRAIGAGCEEMRFPDAQNWSDYEQNDRASIPRRGKRR